MQSKRRLIVAETALQIGRSLTVCGRAQIDNTKIRQLSEYHI